MIICREQERTYGTNKAVVVLISDEAPTSVSGADITGLDSAVSCAIGSVCIDPTHNKKYMVGCDNAWHLLS